MEEKKVKLITGALLHDIGKLLYRYNDGRNHSMSGYEYLRDEIGIETDEILEQVRFHHASALKNADIDRKSLAYITYVADNIAASSDRRKAEDEEVGFDPEIALSSIFNLLNNNDEKMAYMPQQLTDKINYPKEQVEAFDKSFYGNVVTHLEANLKAISFTEEYLNSLLELLEAELSYIPSSTAKGEVADISLFDHVKLTAAFASCIEAWLVENQIEDYKTVLYQNAEGFYAQKAFLLFSMDMSGIQDFIYTIASKDALKMLRSRSFYLEILMEHLIDELLQKLELSRTNLVYSGGGHAYMLLPNTNNTYEIIDTFEKEVNEWLLQQFHTSLYLGCGFCECSSHDLCNYPEGAYRSIFKTVSSMITAKKTHRYSAEQMICLNKNTEKDKTRECVICRTSDALTEDNICQVCDSLIKMSGNILHKSFYGITECADMKPALPLPFNKWAIAKDEAQMIELIKCGDVLRVYTKNEAYTGINIAKRLWVGDYTNGETFEELANNSAGVNRLAVLRADVDGLGNAFVNGFASEKYGEQYMTISRTATFSRKMSMFFKYHINSILNEGSYNIGSGGDDKKRSITIVYSGGDDVFIVGSWDEVISFAIDLYEAFKKFTQGTLTFSAGIGIYPGKYPISTMARQVGELENAAKGHPEKNAVALFDDEFVFAWEEFKTDVIEEKLSFIRDFFSHFPDKGNGFLYKLLELLRDIESDGEKINLARLAYLMARLERSTSENVAKSGIGVLSKQVYEWAINPEKRKSFILAIYIYVYLTRDGVKE